jgi:4-oxalocrotonate tautomerase
MPGLVPGIHVLIMRYRSKKTWMAGTNPAMTIETRAKGETKMPEITVSMAAGRTDEQKAGMMRDITQALVKNLGVDADAVVIQINEAPLAHKMKGGKTFVERKAAQAK